MVTLNQESGVNANVVSKTTARSSAKKKAIFNSEKVIVVERDQIARAVIARVLLKMHYRVDCFADFGDAITNAHGIKARLVIISVYETELLDMILAQFPPDTGVLIVTDAQNMPAAAQSKCCAIRSFLLRPFTSRQLGESVLQTIDGVNQISESLRNSAFSEIDEKQVFWRKSDDSFVQLLNLLSNRTEPCYVSVLLKDAVTGKYSVRAEKGVSNPSWNFICEKITKIDNGSAVVYSPTNSPPELARLMKKSSVECMLCAPLIVKGEIVGVINQVKSQTNSSFKPSDAAFTSLLTRQFGMGMENDALSADMRTQQNYVGKLLKEIGSAQTNERRRVATEIHDGVAQWLVGAALDISACHQLISCNQLDDVGDSLLRVKETLQNSIRELRRAIADLRPELLIRLGLVNAITQSIEALKMEGIECVLKLDGPTPRFDKAVETNVYWILQEILSNIHKHAQATSVSILLQNSEDRFTVVIEDDGIGFDLDSVNNSGVILEHVGMVGMRERAELLCAKLTIVSTRGKGTKACLTLPAVISQMEGETVGENT